MKKKRLIMMFAGILLLGFAVSLFRLAAFGTDPFTTMNLGVSGYMGMTFGMYQLLVNIALFIIVCFFVRHCIGLGTIVNMVGIGFISDFFFYFYSLLLDGSLTMLMRCIVMAIAVLFTCMAVALYMTADLGIAPYDAMAIIIQRASKGQISFAWARIGTDVTAVVIGFSFGAIVGIGTLVTAFFTGPLVQLFRTHITDPLLKADILLQESEIKVKI